MGKNRGPPQQSRESRHGLSLATPSLDQVGRVSDPPHLPYFPPPFFATHASYSFRGMNRSDALLMQYRSPPFARGPSSNTWPRCAPSTFECTSTRTIPWLVSR